MRAGASAARPPLKAASGRRIVLPPRLLKGASKAVNSYPEQHGALRWLYSRLAVEAVDSILRTTIASKAYDSDDFYEGVRASHNDYGTMQAYATAFVDAFWRDF